MSEIVSSFEKLKIGEYKYTFIIVYWNQYDSHIKKEMIRHFESFGADLGLNANVVKPFEQSSYKTAEQVISKEWPEQINRKFADMQDPIVLVIDKDFEAFNPKGDSWAIIWFSDYFKNTEYIYRLFILLANRVKKDESLFAFLKKQAKRDALKRWINVLELKPNIFGLGINANKLIDELT